ncbi:MAG: orotidine-5'-phosphate decarboxylase [Proteobacteria bacterium]|jgi:orotidine-5'-phosphate decarboxylase|nr:orotidine-5'-phosphate decarboxylase [Alphaproteobacteria bacterium]NCC03127.1 orotidine-5'-phosphate decarboxylase [Pseudomonadota bacterium]
MTYQSPVFCAIDKPSVESAIEVARQVKGGVGGLKLGLEYFLANGAHGYQAIADLGLPIFLDVKLHDIPNTVAGAVKSLLSLQPEFITLHTGGGSAMMKAAADAAATATGKRPRLLGVTVLTSLDSNDLSAVGQDTDTARQVERLALLAQESGIDGIVCSSAEVARLRKALGPDFVLMVPGIRPAWSAANDQKRIMTPADAMEAGASYLVIGRPITGAKNPADAVKRINEELQSSPSCPGKGSCCGSCCG